MNYIYLTDKTQQETKADIESKKIVLDTLETDIVWIINKEDAERDEKFIIARAMKV